METFPIPRVLQCARYINSPSRRDERRVKDYEFDLYLGGEREVWVDGKHYCLSEGYMYFKRPGEVVAGVGDYNVYMITLDFADMPDLSPPHITVTVTAIRNGPLNLTSCASFRLSFLLITSRILSSFMKRSSPAPFPRQITESLNAHTLRSLSSLSLRMPRGTSARRSRFLPQMVRNI